MSRTAALGLILLAVLVLGLGFPAAPVSASGPDTLCDAPLVLVSGSQHVRLTAAIMEANLTCDGPSCTLDSTQTYVLRNESYSEAAYLTLGLPVLGEGACRETSDLRLQDANGTIMTPAGASAEFAATWQIRLPAGSSRTLTLVHTWQIGEQRLIQWRWASSLLSSWPAIDGARVEYRLPTLATDDAFAYVQPTCLDFDGRRLVWSYEKVESLPDHGLLMVAPPTLRALNDLRNSAAHHDLARLLLEVRAEAEARHLAIPDPIGEILAALASAADDRPGNVSVHLDIARAYQAAAETYPDLRVDYLLLAVEEMESTCALMPADQTVTDLLASGYYDLAVASSEAGAPGQALNYLRHAQAIGGGTLSADAGQIENLFMRWALELAEQGRVDEALDEVSEKLSPGTLDALLRWAPPVTLTETRVTLKPGHRSIEYELRPYAPLAHSIQALVTETARAMAQVNGCTVTASTQESVITLGIEVAFSSLDDLREKNAELLRTLPAPRDLVSEMIAAPLESSVESFEIAPGLLRDRLVYRECVDLAPLKTLWNSQTEYASWRLVELTDLQPTDDRARLEVEMALTAVRNQSAIWDCVPMGAHLVYTLETADGHPHAAESVWRVGWGETRNLALERSSWHWARLALLSVLGVAGLALLLGALVGRPRPHRRVPPGRH